MDSTRSWLGRPGAFEMNTRCRAASRIWTKLARDSSGFVTVTTPTLPTWGSLPARNRKSFRFEIYLGVTAMDAKERDLPFRQIHRKMISILRHLVERELTDQIRSGAITDDTVGLQL